MERIDYRQRLAAGTWDLIIADIPWGYTPDHHAKTKHIVSYDTLNDYTEMFSAFSAALHPNRNAWVWTDWYNLPLLLDAAARAGLSYRGLCVMKRLDLGLGSFSRKNLYFLPAWSRGRAYRNAAGWLPEYLGEYKVRRSKKPQAVYDRIVAHSLPPGGAWIDPFPATHVEEYRGPQGSTILKPVLFEA